MQTTRRSLFGLLIAGAVSVSPLARALGQKTEAQPVFFDTGGGDIYAGPSIVDHIRPQKYPSALLTSNALWVSSGEITTAPDYSDSNLPAWPAWIVVGLFALFCILRAINVFRKPDR